MDLGALAKGDLQPFAVASLSAAAASANSDLLTLPLEFDEDGTLRVLVEVSASATFNMVLTNGTDSVTAALNNGAGALTSGQWYAFDIPVQSGDKVNFQVDTACTIWLRANKLLTQ